jgi:hypothetical protein
MTADEVFLGFLVLVALVCALAWFCCESFERALDVEGEGE